MSTSPGFLNSVRSTVGFWSAGIQSLSQAYEQTPDFVDEKGAQDVTRQLAEVDAMLNMLKANHFKLLQARSEVASSPIPNSPYSEYVQQRRDKNVRNKLERAIQWMIG